jgi:membrane protein
MRSRYEQVINRGGEWADAQDPAAFRGVAVAGWRSYRAVDGPLQSALLSLYIFLAVLPALLVIDEYLTNNPRALADHIVEHYGFDETTASLFRGLFAHTTPHRLGSALLAIAGALFFGLGFGRVLQLIHVRAWRLSLPARRSDQARHAAVLVGVYGFLLLFLVQVKALIDAPLWLVATLAPGWAAVLFLFFVWASRLLTYNLVPVRDLAPAAAATAIGLVALMGLSRLVFQFWINLYARDYGSFGGVMAIYFWILFSAGVIVGAASLSPALAERRRLRAARHARAAPSRTAG